MKNIRLRFLILMIALFYLPYKFLYILVFMVFGIWIWLFLGENAIEQFLFFVELPDMIITKINDRIHGVKNRLFVKKGFPWQK